MVWKLEHTVFVSFALDIVFNFVRIPETDDDDKAKDHSFVAKKYMKSGQFFLDFLATFPFYLLPTNEENKQATVMIKLIRMVRIPRIVDLLNLSRFNKFIEAISQGQTRGRRVVF